jgi:hypothetical protein
MEDNLCYPKRVSGRVGKTLSKRRGVIAVFEPAQKVLSALGVAQKVSV